MTVLKIFLCITVGGFVAPSLYADIYEWTDIEGVKHYTNYAPPPEAKILMKTEELPYDEAADRARMEAEREEQLALARLELAERKAELEWREAQTEQRLAEADRRAEETLREADKILNEARNSRYDDRNYGYANYFRGYYPYHYKNRYYYRNETGSIFFRKPPHIGHFKHYHYTKRHSGHNKKQLLNNYRDRKYPYKSTHPRYSGLRWHNRNYPGQLSIRSHGRSHTALNRSGRVNAVSRVRHN